MSSTETIIILVDPPSGWRYGFPALLQKDYEQQLRDAGYPENHIPMALKHSRYIRKEDCFEVNSEDDT